MAPKPGKWFGRLANRIGRIFTGRQPEPPPYYEPEPPYIPPLGGQLQDYDEEPYDVLPYEELPEDTYDEPYVEEPVSTEFLDWEPEEDITLLDANREVIGSMPKETWFDELLESKEYIQQTYGMSHWDLMYALEKAGQWDAEDWRQWRELYDQI